MAKRAPRIWSEVDNRKAKLEVIDSALALLREAPDSVGLEGELGWEHLAAVALQRDGLEVDDDVLKVIGANIRKAGTDLGICDRAPDEEEE
mgnify:CR=1 FL=1